MESVSASDSSERSARANLVLNLRREFETIYSAFIQVHKIWLIHPSGEHNLGRITRRGKLRSYDATGRKKEDLKSTNTSAI